MNVIKARPQRGPSSLYKGVQTLSKGGGGGTPGGHPQRFHLHFMKKNVF